MKSTTNSATSPRSSAGIRWSESSAAPPSSRLKSGYVAGDSVTSGLKFVEVRDTVNIADALTRFLRVKVSH